MSLVEYKKTKGGNMKLSEVLNPPNENDINLDIRDLDTVFSHEGFAYIKTLKCKQMDECLEKIKAKFKMKG